MTNYPFSAIVGQEDMKTALLLNAVNPRLGGVLVRGEKGTAKSTAVRALGALLPEVQTMDCPFGCDPERPERYCPECRAAMEAGESPSVVSRPIRVVDLPVGATEDRLVGTLDMERAIRHGEKRFDPGILARANRSILYVDEVNLLDDHLVDVLLDAAAMGVNTVEREGVSYTHPAEFLLVGTMNPEEGELRPQLLDRFGLCINVRGVDEVPERMEVVRRRVAFEADPEAFAEQWAQAEADLAEHIAKARKVLPGVSIGDEALERIARVAVEVGVDGHRADIVMMKCALTLAALDGCTDVRQNDLREAARFALPHRMRRRPFQEVGVENERLDQAFAKTG